MNLRHAAALALIGWYLMIPPINPADIGSSTVKIDSPLAQWKTYKSFDSAAECEAAKPEMINAIASGLSEFQKKDKTNPEYVGAWNAKCVASDDPRLKSN
jgi:hypothetical protein